MRKGSDAINMKGYMVKNSGMFRLSHTIDKPIPYTRKYRVLDALKMGMHYDWRKPLPFSALNIPFDCGRQFDVIDIDDKTDRKTFYATYPQFGREDAKYERDYLCVLPIHATCLLASIGFSTSMCFVSSLSSANSPPLPSSPNHRFSSNTPRH